jgi:hypothetical protein
VILCNLASVSVFAVVYLSKPSAFKSPADAIRMVDDRQRQAETIKTQQLQEDICLLGAQSKRKFRNGANFQFDPTKEEE